MRLQSLSALILLAGTIPAASAQTYKAAKVVFQNAGMYSQPQLESVAAMHPGTSFTAAGLGDAAQRLLDTGFFTDVGATLGTGSVNAATVLFTTRPVPVSDMIHLSFQNFVWLTPAEIQAALRQKAPLFSGYLPESSPLVDTFDATLAQALAAKGVTATVTHETFEPTLLRPERVLEYRIASPRIRIANIKLEGIPPALAPLVQKSVNAAAGFGYSDGLAHQTTAEAIVAPLLDAGYARAALSGISVAPSVTSEGASVIVSATLSTGDIFHVTAVNFPGAPLLSATDFAAQAKLHPGGIASRELLLETLAPLDAAYRARGYMDVLIKTSPQFDDAAHTVAYNISVVPGDQYRIRDVTAENLPADALADFKHAFRLTQGELYNPDYVHNFLKNNTLVQSLMPYSGTYKAYADPNTRTVDLVITFFPQITR